MMGRVSFPVRYNEGFAGKVPGQDLAHFPSVNTWDISWSNRGPLYRREKSVANSATDRPNQCDEASTLFTGRQALHRRDARILLRGIDQKVNGLFLASAEGSPRCPHSLGYESIVHERHRFCFPGNPTTTCVYVIFHFLYCLNEFWDMYINGWSLDLMWFSFQETWIMHVGNSS